MKQRATKYATKYWREFSTAELNAAAKAAFIVDLGGPAGMERRGLKASSIKVETFGSQTTCRVESLACAIDAPTPLAFAEFPAREPVDPDA